jgi:hypothetical protein
MDRGNILDFLKREPNADRMMLVSTMREGYSTSKLLVNYLGIRYRKSFKLSPRHWYSAWRSQGTVVFTN